MINSGMDLECHLTAPFKILRAAQPHIKRLFLEEKKMELPILEK